MALSTTVASLGRWALGAVTSLAVLGAGATVAPAQAERKAAKPVAAKTSKTPKANKSDRVAKAGAAAAAVAVPAALAVPSAPLGDAELALAGNVFVGQIPCELGQTVDLRADPAAPGHFVLRLKEQRFHLRPVVSATGALRLEDTVQGAVWLQLANKSMLMSQKQGRRLADECMSPVQQAMADHLKANPAPSLLDVAQSPR